MVALSVSVFAAAFHVYAPFVLQTGSGPMVRRLPATEIVPVKSGTGPQLVVPGGYAESLPPLEIFISQRPADVPTGSGGAWRCQHPTIVLGTPIVDAEATAPVTRTANATAAAAARTIPSCEA